jgi:hypothetical protein
MRQARAFFFVCAGLFLLALLPTPVSAGDRSLMRNRTR